MEQAVKPPRYVLLDTVRGVTVVNMILYHFLYDWYVVLGHAPGWPWLTGVRIWERLICGTFILLAGICLHFDRHPVRRGGMLFGWGCVITLVTMLVMPGQAVHFGILSFLGVAIALTGALRGVLGRIPAWAGLAGSLVLFVLLRRISAGLITIGPLVLAQMPAGLYQWYAGALLGFPPAGFVSSDYFPLLPWLFLLWCGWFGWRLAAPRLTAGKLLQRHIPAFTAIGRKSLLLYLLHQPVCMALAFGLNAVI